MQFLGPVNILNLVNLKRQHEGTRREDGKICLDILRKTTESLNEGSLTPARILTGFLKRSLDHIRPTRIFSHAFAHCLFVVLMMEVGNSGLVLYTATFNPKF